MTGNLTTGVYTIPATAYHADPCPAPSLSSSGARQIMAECPARYWADRQNPPEPTEALNLGSAAHEWLLEGERWPQRHVVLPEDHDGRSKDGKIRIAAIEAEGKRPLKAEHFSIIRQMRDALVMHPYAFQAFQGGKSEQTLIWRDEEFGIWCRARPDFLSATSPIVPDYKTTRSAEREDLRRAMYEYGYHQQADWYLTGIRALGLFENPSFLFLFQEKLQPYLVVPVMCEDVALQWAAMMNRKARETFARCLDAGEWPGYTDDIITLGLPVWAEQQLQRRADLGAFEVAYRAQAPLTAAE